MKKLSYFLMVGLAFTVLQVSTVAAQTGDPNMPPPTGATGMPPMGDSCMTVPAGPDRDACYSSMSGSSMPPTTGGPPPMTGGMPPMGDSCMTVPAGPDRDACYSSMSGSSMPPGAPGMAPGTN